MKKSTKVISMVIAVTLVMAIMTFVIYAATAGKVGINASVSWTAQAGVDLEFWGRVSGGDTTKEIAKTYINPTTTNATAKIVDDLSCNFSDNTDDGVNNPKAITFKYYVRNKSLTPLKIQVTKHPTQAEESGTSEADHTPKVELSSQVGEENTLVSAIGAGYDLKAGDLFEYSVTLSMASGGTGNINADTGLAQNFDAGVTFNFTVGGNLNGTIITSVDGATPTSASSSTLVGQTLGEYLATQQTAEYSTGWFFDEGLTKVVSDDYLSQDLKDSSASSFYNKTASITGLTFTLSSGGNSYLVAGESNTSPSGEVVIPNMYNGKPVSGFVEYGTFGNNSSITSVILPNSITSIGMGVFYKCSGLTRVSIPNTVTSIGERAFYYCENLSNIEIPNSVNLIDEEAFKNCCGLTSVSIKNGNVNLIIGVQAFASCGLTSLNFPDGIIEINEDAYMWCIDLANIIIPKSVISLGKNVFQGCDNISSVVVNEDNDRYDSRDNCNAIIESDTNILIYGFKTTIIPNTVTSIGSYAFYRCSTLTKIEIPNNVLSIEDNAFSGCSELTSITIGNGVKSIGDSAFYSCGNLTNMVIPDNVTSLGVWVFEGSGLIDVSLGNGVKSIGGGAFSACDSLINIDIPDNVTTIGSGLFSNCNELVSVKLGKGITSIESNTFYGCGKLTSVVIPDSVTSIGTMAFMSCKSLTKIFIPKSVTIITASSYSNSPFYSCSSSLKIYCEVSSKPSGWRTYWNYYASGKTLNVTWGVTRAQFDAL